jgi:hypothetical protein
MAYYQRLTFRLFLCEHQHGTPAAQKVGIEPGHVQLGVGGIAQRPLFNEAVKSLMLAITRHVALVKPSCRTGGIG